MSSAWVSRYRMEEHIEESVTESQPTTVVIVDDHQMFREGVCRRLDEEPDFTVIGQAACADDGVRLIREVSPQIVVLDIRMPGTSGIELARALRSRYPDLKMLVVSGYDFDQYVRTLARIGVQGFVLKDEPLDHLVAALREIVLGGTVLPSPVATKLIRSYSVGEAPPPHPVELTLREIEVLEFLAQGMRNGEIGKRLDISPRTVETHVTNINHKLGARGRIEAVRIAIDRGLVK